MHCPRCGQERISEATSFCSKCGLFLDHIEEVMANGGEPLFDPAQEGEGRWFSRRNIRIFALIWFVIVTVILTPISAIFNAEEEVTAVLGLIGPVIALLMLVISFVVPKDVTAAAARAKRKTRRDLEETESRRELPPDRTVFAEDFVAPGSESRPGEGQHAARTPPSVTEETTRHLDKKKRD